MRRLAVRLVLGAAVAGSGLGLLGEIRDAIALFDARQNNTVPFFWRFGMAPVERFASCVEAARPLLPRGSIVAFASPPGPRDAEFYRWRWAAYLLPEAHLVRFGEREEGARAGYVLTCRQPVEGQGVAGQSAGDQRAVGQRGAGQPGAGRQDAGRRGASQRLELVRQLPGGRLYRVMP